ncbi:hypothetical protein ACG33_06175 [Steroidobacter denitrificans]|uniref:Pro-apoptotic serine protease NMA111 n=1 Tax=Steroidobacter denitrificans TaxID=465721 RepID=A0A127F8F2_STEDE|nr:trypsin-like peptidase domain-containing protein [Steroidobacter denitrificans]AMN46687.1 hypothetical protein ACG33_06175 [Steroidobacter denitrificans]
MYRTLIVFAHAVIVAATLAAVPSRAAAPDISAPPQDAVPAAPVPVPEDSRWTRTLERVATGVVTIQVDLARAFDTEWNISSQATGFVVDARRGLILTNRHVVTPGPVTAQAVFLNREEVTLYPVYRDPIHDFGFYRYDPAKLRFIKPAELKLYPQGAQVGREIRVIGNDAGEQLSILAGTLARLDRQAPNYGVGKYNDFNTFYYQAASSTSGGSSGSPVIDIEGRVLALNAGGSSAAASSFYLPLDRVQRALQLIQEGKPVARGTLQTIFRYTPFDEVRRLGLQTATESAMRRSFPDKTGMLVVAEVQPGAAAEQMLEPGDVLIRVNSRLSADFDALARALDGAIGQRIRLSIERGGQAFERDIVVQDLHAITPDRFLEFGDAVVHDLSWQQARHINKPIRGIYVANPGYVLAAAGITRGAILTSINGRDIGGLDELEPLLQRLQDGERAAVRFFTLEEPNTTQVRVIRMDRRWFPARSCRRDDARGTWPCVSWAPDGQAQLPQTATTSFAKTADAIVDRVAPSLVLVNFDMPYSVSGISERNYHGTGLIVDAQRGLVVIDRNTVPIPLGDVRVTFAGSIEIPGRVKYIHPLHNLAVISYDPRLIGATPVRAARLRPEELSPGEPVWVVGMRQDGKVLSRSTQVASIDPVLYPLTRTLRFRETNLETVSLVNAPGDYDGVLVNKNGEVLAGWASFAYEAGRDLRQENRGIPAELLAQTLSLAREGSPLYSLEAELRPVPLASARKLGLSDRWVRRLERHSPGRRQVLSIERLVGGSPASGLLLPGDLILEVEGALVNRFSELEQVVQERGRNPAVHVAGHPDPLETPPDKTQVEDGRAPIVRVTVLRNGAQQTFQVPTVALAGGDLDRILVWAGAVLQKPHRALAAQRGIAPEGVFVSYFSFGSPAARYKLWAGRRIVEVDGQFVADLDAFIAALQGKDDRASLRLKTVAWNGAVDVITLQLDKRYWPTYELQATPQGWMRVPLD